MSENEDRFEATDSNGEGIEDGDIEWTGPFPDSSTIVPLSSVSDYLDELEAPASSPPWCVFHERNPHFIGREDLLTEIHEKLQSGKTTVLTQEDPDWYGIGKTQVAIEYAHRYRFRYSAVFWLNTQTDESMVTGYMTVANLLQLPEAAATNYMDVVLGVYAWLAAHPNWLMIVDNAERSSVELETGPAALKGHVLTITRDRPTDSLGHVICMEPLSQQEGALLLLRRARILSDTAPLSAAPKKDRIAALDIARRTGGMPLALTLTGLYIVNSGTTPQGHLAEYVTRRNSVTAEGIDLGAERNASTLDIIFMAYVKLGKHHRAAGDLVRICSFLDISLIPTEMFTPATDLGEWLSVAAHDSMSLVQTFHEAARWGLMEYDSKLSTLAMNRTVQGVIYGWMKRDEQALWINRAMMAFLCAFTTTDEADWLVFDRLMPQVTYLKLWTEKCRVYSVPAAGVLCEACGYLCKRKRYEVAEPLMQLAVEITVKAAGEEHLNTAIVLRNLAVLYVRMGETEKAETYNQRSQAILIALRAKEQGGEEGS